MTSDDNLVRWNRVRRPPKEVLRPIGGGRLKGMTDISPQWRLEAMTAEYGEIGVGWRYAVTSRWTERLGDGETAMFIEIELFTRQGDQWSAPIYGVGGTMLIARERDGLRLNDEAPKMAITDALSVAMKQLGIGADIYMGLWDGSKWKIPPGGSENEQVTVEPVEPVEPAHEQFISEEQQLELAKLIRETKANGELFMQYLGIDAMDNLPAFRFDYAKQVLLNAQKARNGKT